VITGILVALPEELHTLSSVKLKPGQSHFLSDTLLVILSGAGIENAEKATQQLIAQGAKQLISWGCAGALAAQLKAGDLFIPSQIQTHAGEHLSINSDFYHKLRATLQQTAHHTGLLLESAQIISQAQEKNALHQSTQALATDMESAALAQVAQQADLPFIAIRSIVDEAHFNLPNAVQYAMQKDGRVSLGKLLLYLIGHPFEIPRLIQLGQHFNAASKTLAKISPLLVKMTAL